MPNNHMNLRQITLTTLTALSLGSVLFAQDQDGQDRERHGGRGGRNHDMLARMTERLNLTPEQKTRIQPIVDQAKPKIAAIHQEAMQKSKAVLDEAMTQIRPMLTLEQQKQLEDMHNDRRGGHEGHRGRPDDGDESF
jgi:Spy/CpxP family protein refolding chaperone